MVDQEISQHRAAEGPADERCHHRVSQGRAPLSQNRKCERFWTLPEVAIPREMFQEILRLIAELRPIPALTPAQDVRCSALRFILVGVIAHYVIKRSIETYYSKPITFSKMRASLANSAGLLNQRESYCNLYLIHKLVVFCVLTCDFRNRVRQTFRAAELAKAVKDDN